MNHSMAAVKKNQASEMLLTEGSLLQGCGDTQYETNCPNHHSLPDGNTGGGVPSQATFDLTQELLPASIAEWTTGLAVILRA